MNVFDFIKGIVAGAIIAIPVGPIGILCLRRMLIQGPLMGIASGLGAATADLIYSTTAMAGMTIVSTFLFYHSMFIRIVSSLFLCALGIKIILSKPAPPIKSRTHDMVEAFISTFFLTLANPLLIFTFIAMFAILNISYEITSYMGVLFISAGVFIGSTLWWLILGGITSLLHPKISPKTLRKVNKISGTTIIIFGIITLLSILFK